MSKREPFIVNGKLFETKDMLKKHIQGIMGKYEDRARLSEDDFDFMVDLLQRHENPEIKIGVGIDYMYVTTNTTYGGRNREFWLVRIDGSQTDFSFMKCLKHESRLQKFKKACRNAVAPTINEFKIECFLEGPSLCCPLSGEVMTLDNNCHVDHEAPNTFDVIVSDFITSTLVNVDEVELLTGEDGRVTVDFVDKVLEQKFVEFHNERAKLRLLSRLGNLSLARRGVLINP